MSDGYLAMEMLTLQANLYDSKCIGSAADAPTWLAWIYWTFTTSCWIGVFFSSDNGAVLLANLIGTPIVALIVWFIIDMSFYRAYWKKRRRIIHEADVTLDRARKLLKEKGYDVK